MPPQQTAIRNYFNRLELGSEIADIYLALYSHGPQSISTLSRNSKVERTRIYRLIEGLTASNLVEVEEGYKRNVFRAAPISNLRILLTKKEQDLEGLKQDLGIIEQTFVQNTLNSPATRVQFYHGPEGIKQMIWNQFRAKTPILSIMRQPIQNLVEPSFFKRWAEKWNEQDNTSRLLYNQEFLGLTNAWHAKHPGYAVNNYDSRLLPESVYNVTFCADVYDDVVAYYNWHKGEVYGIEIYNQDIANAQAHFFELLWPQAKKMGPNQDIGLA